MHAVAADIAHSYFTIACEFSSTTDGDGADEQPDRVVLVEDLRPFLFKLSQPASLR